MKNNVVGWFEIPVIDMERATSFYEKVFGFKMQRSDMGPLKMCFFPWAEGGNGTGGSLVEMAEFYKPKDNGVLIYFTAQSGDLSNELAKVNEAGGKVLFEKKQISENNGFMGVFLDSEGNRIAVHSKK